MWPFNDKKRTKKNLEVTIIEETDIIIVEDQHYRKHNLEDELEKDVHLELEIIKTLTHIIDRLTKPKKHQRVKQVLTQICNNTKTIIMAFQLASNQKASITLSLIDADTLQPITASFTGETETSDNPAVATTDPANGLVGVAPGTGNLTSVATWTYTDSNTGQPVTVELTTVTPFEVTAVVTAEKVSQVVTLGTPVAQ